jgi:hypothetical protein
LKTKTKQRDSGELSTALMESSYSKWNGIRSTKAGREKVRRQTKRSADYTMQREHSIDGIASTGAKSFTKKEPQ